MSSLKNEFMNTHDLYSTGQEMQMVRDETGALRAQLVPPPPPPVATATPEGEMQFGTVGEAVKDLPRAMAGAAPGLVTGGVRGIAEAAALVVSAIPGAYAAYKAGDGEGLQSYLNVLEEHSNKYGGGRVKALADSALDMMGVSEEDKEQFNLAADVGEIYGVGEGLVKAPVIATRVARDAIRRQRGAASELGAIGPEIQAQIDPRKTIAMQPREVIEGLDDETRGIIRDLATQKRAAETVAPGLDDTQIITGDELLRTLDKAQKKIPSRKQDELGFYSRAQEFVDNLQQEKLTGPQLKGQMLNAGVKADELKWTGLDEFLEANPKLTKQEAMDFIDQNKVKLEEITYEGGTLNPDTHQSFGNAEVIDDYEEINFQRERIDDEINSGDDYYLEQALERRGYDVTSGVAAYKELMQATGGRFLNVEPEVLAPIQAKYPDVDVKNVGWEVDAELTEVARENYFNNPYYEVNGEGMLEDYRIVGNDDTGYYVTYQNQAVDDITDVYSLNEAQVQVQQDAIDRGLDTGAGDTQYSEYTQEGAENYREVLLTNPGYKGDPSFELNETQRARLKELKEKVNAEMERRTQSGEAPIYGPQDALSAKEMTDYEALNWQDRQVGMPPRSPHWQENDVVAHARLSDRTVMGGETLPGYRGPRAPKALYIEELQSDWAQTGRRRGFGAQEFEFSEPIQKGKDDKGRDTWVVNSKDADGLERPHKFLGGPTEFPTKEAALEAIEREKKIRPKGLGRVQEGPLVGKTDKWTEMSMRRLIRKAADEGYDYIAWTPGDVQFDRWNEEGLETYYNNVLPKATGNVAKKLDKEAKVKPIEISIDGEPQKTLALPITDKLKTMAKEGQPLFAVPAAVGVGAALKPKEETDGNL
jgi:hypothetical protein